MANTDAARGFVPVGHFTGGEIRTRSYPLDNESSAIYKGDLLKMAYRGQVALGAAGDAEFAIGIAAESKNSTDVADDDSILVWDDPQIIYEVQGYTGVTFAAGDVGQMADHVANSGSATYMISRQELNDPGAAGPTNQFLILGLSPKVGNEWGEHAKLLVKFYEHMALTARATS